MLRPIGESAVDIARVAKAALKLGNIKTATNCLQTLITLRVVPHNALMWTLHDQAIVDGLIGEVLAAAYPRWRLALKYSRCGRPPADDAKKLDMEVRDREIFAAVRAAEVERLKQIDGTKSITAVVQLKRIYHDVGRRKEFKLKGDTVRRICAKMSKQLQVPDRVSQPFNALLAVRGRRKKGRQAQRQRNSSN